MWHVWRVWVGAQIWGVGCGGGGLGNLAVDEQGDKPCIYSSVFPQPLSVKIFWGFSATRITLIMACSPLEKKNLKQNWPPTFWKKIQNTQEIKRMLFNWTKQDNTRKFWRKSSFSSYVQHKNRKTNNYFNLTCISWLWEAGRRTESQSRARSLLPASHIQLTQVSWINCLFFCFYAVRSLKERTSSNICTFCPVSSN